MLLDSLFQTFQLHPVLTLHLHIKASNISIISSCTSAC
ncbi:Hypothetical protein Minf_1856 [Methylacidiphilum infernorum V4]|uniref:Uncharacterized protein n=1 Tax=Methylacidiphilum infernorum (isolate V4) TaxID=481448 RepID=B3DXV8_METI4|nr:Hypothetical protein Minf_1856 [Methylacidiphilum infernorum V4]